MKGRSERVVVIGAGIAGVSAAIWLQREGCEVVLVDRLDPGEGASFGNAGVLAVSAVVPVTTPGLAMKAPFHALNPDSPLFVVWRRLPLFAPWLLRYLLHANDKDTRRIASGLADIVCDSVEQHAAIAVGTGAEKWLRDSDYVFAYKSRAEFERDRYVWSLRREAGLTPEIVEGGAVREVQPALGPRTQLLAVLRNHGYVRSPSRYVKDLAAHFIDQGGAFRKTQVRRIGLSGGRVRSVDTDYGGIACETAVIAAGVWSGDLLQSIGLKIPVQSERGYHLHFKNPSFEFAGPIMVAAGKFVATPMEDGIRCAGVLEFGGLGQPPSTAPLAFIRRKATEVFPNLQWDSEEQWSGHRPAPCDSLPLIGEAASTRVFMAFGHHHIGLTGGPKTGRIVARLVAGGDPGLDASVFSPNRFR